MIETEEAYAKINLSLDIINKMDDGFHYIRTVMQSISLSDEITVENVPGVGVRAGSIRVGSVRVGSNLPFLPGDERNIAAKAATAFFTYTGIAGYDTLIRINKKIPVCAGLGGGSADGACVLRILDRMFDTRLGFEVLEKIGNSVGSDVPFCVRGGTRLAEGRGELLSELTPIPKCYTVLCKPPVSCSTPELFGRVKCEKIRARPDTDGIVKALGTGDLRGIACRMYNVFEDVLTLGKAEVADIKHKMIDNGALGAVMSGSGATVFGLFDNEADARKAYDKLKPEYKECFLATTVEELGLRT